MMKKLKLKLLLLVLVFVFCGFLAKGLVHKSIYIGERPVFTPRFAFVDGGITPTLKTNGDSMEPYMRDGIHRIERKSYEELSVGDIPIWWEPTEKFWMVHRLVEKHPDHFITQGDNRDYMDRWASPTLFSGWVVSPKA